MNTIMTIINWTIWFIILAVVLISKGFVVANEQSVCTD
jgi:hypothetical protein